MFEVGKVTMTAEQVYFISEALLRADQFIGATKERGKLNGKQMAALEYYWMANENLKGRQ
jgi:hypothetical protein